MVKTAVVVPNWNGKNSLGNCLDSLIGQSVDTEIIVVENGSTDGSLEYVKEKYPQVSLVINKMNLGFAGGVNSGIKKAKANGAEFIALFNNDAVADRYWLENMVNEISKNNSLGIVTCKLTSSDGKLIDSTGDLYTVWGLPFPRGRDEKTSDKYDLKTEIFAASGGASLYRTSLFDDIGYFDKDFFAYYEDVDISFRAQLAGWKVNYVPSSLAYHDHGTTSQTIKGFTTYQSMKNLPWLYWKNVPTKFLFRVGIRFFMAYSLFFISAIARGQFWPALKGMLVSLFYSPKKLVQRFHIQSSKRVASDYIWKIMTHDLPPNAQKLRNLRMRLWKLKRKNTN